MKYQIVYGDGKVGYPHSWEKMLWWVKQTRKLPPSLRPACVIRSEA